MFFRLCPIVAGFLLATSVAYAQAPATPAANQKPLSHHEMREKIKSMTPEERQAFFAERKAQWEAMSKQDKLAEIEKRRAERIAYMEHKWESMSDDEKIAHVERKMKQMSESGGKHCMKGMGGMDRMGHEGMMGGDGGRKDHTGHPNAKGAAH